MNHLVHARTTVGSVQVLVSVSPLLLLFLLEKHRFSRTALGLEKN